MVFLVGFMGAGKTTVGRALARVLSWDFVDLDERIVEEEHRSIAAILDSSGEPYFRALEARLLDDLRGRTRLVVACGGGTYAHEPSRSRIDSMGAAVWLQVPIALALSRCEGGTIRPLLRDPARAESLYHARLPAYRMAPLRIEAAGMSPEEAAERIAALL
jgi:shikimate kinase